MLVVVTRQVFCVTEFFVLLQFESILSFQIAKEEESRKLHYLISTKVRPGIYTSPLKRPQVSQRELELRAAKPLSTDERYMIARQKLAQSLKSGYVDTSSELERYFKRPESLEPLPPIPSTKVQVSRTGTNVCAKDGGEELFTMMHCVWYKKL